MVQASLLTALGLALKLLGSHDLHMSAQVRVQRAQSGVRGSLPLGVVPVLYAPVSGINIPFVFEYCVVIRVIEFHGPIQGCFRMDPRNEKQS
jgi:hypothetical protein